MIESKNILVSKGIRPSIQRLKIYDLLRKTYSHPNVNGIYSALTEEIPSLSKTTVYNVLNLLVQHQLVKEVRIEDNELRYDADMREHGHFKCTQCGQVSDIHYKEDILNLIDKGLKVEEIQLNISGVCKKCSIN